ncbi:MAG: DUF21 domain-containing protein, partial [Bacteroidetes bacterium]|nr:DUF21 domain-containing protein [Bacteroidota bacterium]
METPSLDPESYTEIYQVFLFLLKRDIDFNLVLLILLMVVLITSSAVISGSEVAFFSLKGKTLAKLNKSKNYIDQSIARLMEKPRKLLATILIANNLINISIIILFTIT